ncbi:mitochondrial import receptor subunit TOM22 homolog isoform X2 [Anthonomus grandis grandis]|nr:mitochondrial import receptor subunit TOM22 homolog isoform X2 [Anthonomus grandis grandis]
MESPEASQSNDLNTEKESQDDTVEKEPVKKQPAIENGDEDDEPDESLSERLWGLTEMFPEPLRNFTYNSMVNTKLGLCKAYSVSRSAAWIIFSSSIILFAPVIFEVERANMEEAQRNQQKQMLLGPNSAISGGVPPPIMPVQQR